MRTNCIYNIVWNRKGTPGPGLIQIEIILPDRTRKYISSGYKVSKSEWDCVTRTVKNTVVASTINNSIRETINKLQEHEAKLIHEGRQFCPTDIEKILLLKHNEASFIDFIQVELDKKNIAAGTRYLHQRVRERLKDCGIINFSHLTYPKIQEFDYYIKKWLVAQTSVNKHHAVVKAYIHLAQNHELIPFGSSPYNTFSVARGKTSVRVRLSDKELSDVEMYEFSGSLDIARDLFLFQCYTGISYKDLQSLTLKNIRDDGEDTWIEGLRKKNGEYYSVILHPTAITLIKKYKGGKKLFPVPDQYKQNRDLKVIAAAVKISKTLSTHVGRHTAACSWIRKGIPLEVIQKMLGHEDIETTQHYAKLENRDIKHFMKKAFLKVP
ncbi:MAG: site-specific integrase [Bacteroidales bacterium]|nr:site-specific integrase [Bacteroidales bacterium]